MMMEAKEEAGSGTTTAGEGGVLDGTTTARGLHKMAQSGVCGRFAFVELSLSKLGLTDASYLGEFASENLEVIDVSHNALDSLSFLQHERCPMLRTLRATHNKIVSLELLRATQPGQQSRLEELDLSHNNVTSTKACPQQLVAHPYLRRLNLAYNNMSSLSAAGVRRFIAHSAALQHIDLSHNNLGDFAIGALRNISLPVLQTLNLSHNALESTRYVGMLVLPRLVELDVSYNNLRTLQGVGNNKLHPLLSVVRVNNNASFNDCDLPTRLSSLENMAILDTVGTLLPCNEDAHRLNTIFVITSLKELDGLPVTPSERVACRVAYSGLGDAERAAIAAHHLPYGNKTTAASVHALHQQLTQPHRLRDGQSNIGQIVALSEDQYWNKLGEVGIVRPWEDMALLVKEREPRELNFTGIPLNDIGWWVVATAVNENPCISSLALNSTYDHTAWSSRLSDCFGFRAICNSLSSPTCTITTVSVSACNMSISEGLLLAAVIQSSQSIAHLDVSDNSLGLHVRSAEGGEVVSPCPALEAICNAVVLNTSLISLDLSNNTIDDMGMRVVAACLASQTITHGIVQVVNDQRRRRKRCYLSSLRLGRNTMRVAGGMCVVEALTQNDRIERLDLSSKVPGDGFIAQEVLQALGHALYRKDLSLTHLDLSGNYLTAPTVQALAMAVRKQHPKFVSLRLARCAIQSDEPLADALRFRGHEHRSFVLEELDLSGNKDLDCTALLEAMASNPLLVDCLQELHLGDVHVSEAGARSLAKLLQGNSHLSCLGVGRTFSPPTSHDLRNTAAGVDAVTAEDEEENDNNLTLKQKLIFSPPPLENRRYVQQQEQGQQQDEDSILSARSDASIPTQATDANQSIDFLKVPTAEEISAAVAIQKSWRGFGVRRKLRTKHASAVRIQASYRGFVSRKRNAENRAVVHASQRRAHAAIHIQRVYRGAVVRRKLPHIRPLAAKRATDTLAATTIQTNFKSYAARKEAMRRRKLKQQAQQQADAATRIQAVYRGKKGREKANLFRLTVDPPSLSSSMSSSHSSVLSSAAVAVAPERYDVLSVAALAALVGGIQGSDAIRQLSFSFPASVSPPPAVLDNLVAALSAQTMLDKITLIGCACLSSAQLEAIFQDQSSRVATLELLACMPVASVSFMQTPTFHKHVRSISFAGSTIQSLTDMAQVLAGNHRLKTLCLAHCNLADHPADALLCLLEDGVLGSNVEELDLSFNNLCGDKLQTVLENCSDRSPLVRVDLSGNVVDIEAWLAACTFLARQSNLEELLLPWLAPDVSVTDACQALGEAIPVSQTLTRLTLTLPRDVWTTRNKELMLPGIEHLVHLRVVHPKVERPPHSPAVALAPVDRADTLDAGRMQGLIASHLARNRLLEQK